jgi:hypothetical protein
VDRGVRSLNKLKNSWSAVAKKQIGTPNGNMHMAKAGFECGHAGGFPANFQNN